MRLIVMLIALALMPLCNSCDSLSAFLPGSSGKSEQVGGYSDTRRLTDGEREMFDKYVARIGDIEYEAVNVATQIVAGMNYRFLCKGREVKADGKRGKKFYAAIVLYKPLPGQGEPRITSIERQKR